MKWIRAERLAIAILGVAVAYLLISQVMARFEVNDQADQKVAAQQQAAQNAQDAKAVADPLAELCRTDPSVAARVGDACRVAAEVQQEPVRVVGPTREEIAAAVNAYLREHPPPAGQPPTLDQITTAVAGYLTAHPPLPGRPPTADEIRSAVAAYLADNPPAAGEDGRDGVDGQDGRPPTDAEIDAAVERYFAANPPPAGEKGEKGDPGPTCPEGYELRRVLFVAPEGGTYEGVGCVEPGLSPAPTSTPESPGLLRPN